jgi:hypothetical protein
MSRLVDRCRRVCPGKTLLGSCLIVLACVLTSSPSIAQQRIVHYPQSTYNMVPGANGRAALGRRAPLAGYYQPIEIKGPAGCHIAVAVEGQFMETNPAPVNVGLLIGQVYRFQVTRIPLRPGYEVYPTIEVVDRLYPPAGQASRFPVPVKLTLEEIDLALKGNLVTRVIYVENPAAALGGREDPNEQRYFEARTQDDPLKIADVLGRPIAILRIGSRLPGPNPDASFFYGSPPLQHFPASRQLPAKQEKLLK